MSEQYQCPSCGMELRQQRYLIISAPVGQRSFAKKDIRKKGIRVLGVSAMDTRLVYCENSDCDYWQWPERGKLR